MTGAKWEQARRYVSHAAPLPCLLDGFLQLFHAKCVSWLQTASAWKQMHSALNHQYRQERIQYRLRTRSDHEPPGPPDLYGLDVYKDWQKAKHKELLGSAGQYVHHFSMLLSHYYYCIVFRFDYMLSIVHGALDMP
jgi:hypothetical protein